MQRGSKTFWHRVELASGFGSVYPWSLAGGIVLAQVLTAVRPELRPRMRFAILLLIASLIATTAFIGIRLQVVDDTSTATSVVRFANELCLGLAGIEIISALVFKVGVPALGLKPPPILFDALAGLIYVAAFVFLLGVNGVNVGGLVATSAVLTGILGFSMQDTLSNLIGGISLQAERTISVGDWVRIDGVEGVVRETRWRQTSIETRDLSTIVIPNNMLTKSIVTVLGRRGDTPKMPRATVSFQVDIKHSPEIVIKVVLRAVGSAALPDIAAVPPPICLLTTTELGVAGYQLFFCTADIAGIPRTCSEMRRLIVIALTRAEITLSIPQHRVALTSDRRGPDSLEPHELERRVSSIRHAGLFDVLTDGERLDLAHRLKLAPFRSGESISDQGEAADYLYILISGNASVSIANTKSQTSEVASLRGGDVFGEMGLMTGQSRTATVRAMTEVLCYRLDKESFESTLRQRPDLAASMAQLLAERRVELDGVERQLNDGEIGVAPGQIQEDILIRIRKFFLLG